MYAAILGTLLSPLFRICRDKIVEYVFLPFTYKQNVQTLQDSTGKLKDKRDRLQDSVGDAERNGEVVYDNVRNWLSHSETAIQEAQTVIIVEDGFVGLCPNLKAGYHLSKKAVEKASTIDLLYQQEAALHPISHRPRRQQHVDPSVFALEELESRLSILKQVMEALKDSNLNRVGVWGMGGVGKSILAKEVHGLASKENFFDDVVFVALSEKPKLGEIQKIIGGVLGVNFDVEDKLVQARQLFQRIKNKKTLIILDNIWHKIDLNHIGVPTEIDGKDCTILLISREKRLLVDEMGAQKEFMLEVLTHEEACSMFAKTVPHAKHPDFDDIAIEVVKKCAGLPLLIELVAGCLRNCEELGIWEEKLHQLSNFKDEEIESKVLVFLKSSFNKLIGNEIQSFFLLCALGGQSNIQIQCLLRYCIGLGLFKERPTVSDARKRVYYLINELQDCCLLLKGDMNGYIKMHDIVRDAALSIACIEKRVFACQSGTKLTELPDRDCTTISLPFCDFQDLIGSDSESFKLECPNAELLFLTEDNSLKVSDSFFERLTKLKVLDFTGMCFGCLPSSIKFLTDLQTLCLHRCNLDKLSIIGEFKQLKVLSLSNAYMVELPKEIEQLTRLKILDLSNCSKLKVIPPNVFSKLTLLEELYLGNNSIEWDAECNASLEELEHLSRLSTLEMQVLDHKMIPKFFFFSFKGLKNYRIIIGDKWDWEADDACSRIFKLKFKTTIYSKPGVLKLLKESNDVYLDEVGGIGSVLYDLDGDGFRQLKHLRVQNDPTIQHIVNSTKLSSCPAFPILQSVYLDNLLSLRSLCNGRTTVGSFSKLKVLKVRNCYRLTNLFLFSDNNQGESVKVELTQLHSLTLSNLPMLRSLCSKRKLPLESYARLKQLTIDDPALQEGVTLEDEPLSLFNGPVSLPNLENLSLSLVCCKTIWQDHLSLTSLNLTTLIVESCRNLRHLFTSSMVESLLHLKEIKIQTCDLIEEIILTEDSADETEKICFPKLESLTLEDLPKLSRFSAGHPIEFQSLKELHIKSCSDLTTFVAGNHQVNSEAQILFNEMVGFSKLEILKLDDIKNLVNIWHRELMPDSFSKLKALFISDCHKLLMVFPSDDLPRFHRLESFHIRHCDSLQEIFKFQESNAEEDTYASVKFELRELRISDLGKLKMIWSKDLPTAFTFQELQSVRVYSCEALKNIFPTSIATGLSQLQSLSIQRCVVEGIVEKSESLGSNPYFEFSQLTSLTLWWLPELKCFYPGRHCAEWPKLKCLEFTQCDSAIMFGSEEEAHGEGGGKQDNVSFQPFFLFEKLNHNLEQLTLHHNDLMRIQIGQFPANCFSNVKVLRLEALTPKSSPVLDCFLKTLFSLEELIVDDGSLRELFLNEDAVSVPLKHLNLSRVSYLKHIWTRHARLKPVIQYLETLTIISCASLSKIVQPAISFRNLATLQVSYCGKLKSLLTVETAKTMVNLTEISVGNCELMTEVVENDGDETEDEVVFNKLKTLQLENLWSLASFTSGNHAFSFPLLEEVFVDGCYRMEIFTAGVLSTPKLQSIRKSKFWLDQFWEGNLNATIAYFFLESLLPEVGSDVEVSKFPALKEHWHDQHLGRRFLSVESLTVDGCASFTKALSVNLLHSLNKLTTLEIRECGSMEEVFDLEGVSIDEGSVGLLPRLRELRLIDLPMLRSLWNKDPTQILDLRNLTVLKVEYCNSLKYAFSQSVSLLLVQLQEVHLKNCQMMEGIIEMEEQVVSEIICPSLTKISLHDCPNVKTLFSTEQSSDINYGRKIRLGKEELDIENNAHVDNVKVLPNFEELSLDSSSTINILENLSLKNLRVLKVQNCSNLIHIFTVSMALCLENLEYLEVKKSCLVKHIITTGDEEITLEDKIVFPSLQAITLECLPSLLSFYSAHQVLKCPSLKYIHVTECPKMNLFSSSFSTRQDSSVVIEADDETLGMDILVPPIFGGKVAFPNLEVLRVEWDAVKEIWPGRFGIPFLGRLKAIELTCFPGEQTVLPSNFLQTLRVLEKLVLNSASFEEIFIDEVEAGDQILAHLRALKLCKLPNLKHLMKQDSRLALVIEHLVMLKVVECGRLEVLVSPSVSFQYLTALEVSKCHGLINLMTPATARSLVQLERMVINECEMIQEIVSSESDGVEDEIHLSRLEYFEINGLPRLTSFYSGRFTFNFPSLEEVIIRECPKMETFAQGVVTSSKLCRVQTGERDYEWGWAGSLNDTIHQYWSMESRPTCESFYSHSSCESFYSHSSCESSNTHSTC